MYVVSLITIGELYRNNGNHNNRHPVSIFLQNTVKLLQKLIARMQPHQYRKIGPHSINKCDSNSARHSCHRWICPEDILTFIKVYQET